MRRKELYNIVTEFGIITELVNLIKVCLNETYSKFRVDRYLSDAEHFQNVLKQGVALSPFFQLCFRICHQKGSRKS